MISIGSPILFLFLSLLLVHITFDFYLQTNKMVEDKSGVNGKVRAILTTSIHAFLHAFFSFAACCLFVFIFLKCLNVNVFLLSIKFSLFILVTHFIVDLIKSLVFGYFKGLYCFLLFIIDQVIHISLLAFGVFFIFYQYSNYAFSFDFYFILSLNFSLVILSSIAFLIRPSSIIVSTFLSSSGVDGGTSYIRITRSQVANQLYGMFEKSFASENVVSYKKTSEEYVKKANAFVNVVSNNQSDINIDSVSKVNNAGRVIGYIERVIIFLFLTLGSVTAVVAILAMKTALRFSDLKDDNDSGKAEYIMIGSFLSLLITFLVSAFARLCLSQLGINVKGFS